MQPTRAAPPEQPCSAFDDRSAGDLAYELLPACTEPLTFVIVQSAGLIALLSLSTTDDDFLGKTDTSCAGQRSVDRHETGGAFPRWTASRASRSIDARRCSERIERARANRFSSVSCDQS